MESEALAHTLAVRPAEMKVNIRNDILSEVEAAALFGTLADRLVEVSSTQVTRDWPRWRSRLCTTNSLQA